MAHFILAEQGRQAEQEYLIGGGYPQYTRQPQAPPIRGQGYQHVSRPNNDRKPVPSIPKLYTEQTTSFDNHSLVNGVPPPDPPTNIPSAAAQHTPTVYASTTPIPAGYVQTHFPSTVKWCILLGVLLIWPAWPCAITAFGFALHSRYLAKNGALYYERAKSNGQRARCCCMASLATAVVYAIIVIMGPLGYFMIWLNTPVAVPYNSTISPY